MSQITLERHSEDPQSSQVDDLLRVNDELTELNRRLIEAQEQLVQSEKLASIGQLAAGVAHEINNPVGYIYSNLATLERYVLDLFRMLSAYQAAEGCADTAQTGELRALRTEIDLDFLRDDIPSLLGETREGIERVRKIVQSLKDFSHDDIRREWEWTDLHKGIESTLNIANNEIKYKADVVREYGTLPEVRCVASELNQVFLNLFVNAAHAIDKPRGTIVVRTGLDSESASVWIEVQDDGCGISDSALKKIFDPFFTTKPVGQGTGLGLSLSYGIVKKHGGRIEVKTTAGAGSRFRVTLPIDQQAPAE